MITTDYNTKTTPEEQKLIDSWFYHPPKSDQKERYDLINVRTKKLAELFLEICPPSQDRTDAINGLRLVRMQANAAIACNE